MVLPRYSCVNIFCEMGFPRIAVVLCWSMFPRKGQSLLDKIIRENKQMETMGDSP